MLNRTMQTHKIIELIKTHYDIDIHTLQLIHGGADINSITYKADTKFHSYFVKFKFTHHDEVNLAIIELLHNSGIKEIIIPIRTITGRLFQKLDGFSIIVYPFIDAPNGFTKTLTAHQWLQLGETLKKIHTTSVPSSIQNQLRKETYSTKWYETVRSFYRKIETKSSDDKITTDFKAFFKQNDSIIKQLVESAEKLAKIIQPDPNQYVLCHSDIHAGNVLVTNESIYIIDWDEPMLAPKERDLMFIGGGVGSVWNKPAEIQYFYTGYGKTNIDKTILAYYRYERIIEIAIYGQDLLSNDKSGESRLEMLQHFKNMFEPNDVIEIAFATDS